MAKTKLKKVIDNVYKDTISIKDKDVCLTLLLDKSSISSSVLLLKTCLRLVELVLRLLELEKTIKKPKIEPKA